MTCINRSLAPCGRAGRRRWYLSSPLVLLLVLLFVSPGAPAALPAAIGGKELPSLAPILEGAVPAVVNVATVTRIETAEHPLLRDPFFRYFFDIPEHRERRGESLGSGVIVDAKAGLILTNNHVVSKAQQIEVTLHDGRTLQAKLVGSDPQTDVAVLRVPAKDLTEIPLADSDELRVGDFVIAIGSPFGLAQTVTSGIVSALGRSGLGIEGYESFIQTDASINPGNSGGPLINLRGELIGINTAILAPGGGNVGIGFAIPINMAHVVMDQIVEHGSVRRGLFGVVVQDLTPDLAHALDVDVRRGAVVAKVEADSAAERAGLRSGDVVIAIDGVEVQGAADLRNRIGLRQIGDKLELKVLRDGRQRTVHGVIADPHADYTDGVRVSRSLAGALLGDGSARTERGQLVGVAVGTVDEDSPAWAIGLREGDLVVEVNGQRTGSLQELGYVLRRFGGLSSLSIWRDGQLLQISRR
ncbi:periplasmic serine protease, Do/DeqQ family [Thioflavicoccus mobilis 8321]|uniref:Periplasmic serine protease, Do/DeqQ family n=1 Tax=Thioflavicoccus mobilis 8321 TaxID=765912 RepID=L0GUN5_9GAMM|nr:DegQ family serine endoprotease [Thioflavicoccus mobilis]AGA89004.1 periplasmic serine protease, Do/DeqQ family [Thioflavicoccus mobilis 8321]